VTTLDGRQTSLHTGETYYYEVAVAAATTGGIVKDIRTFDVGVSLIVNPHINDNDEITMTISPSVAALRGTSEFSLPIVTERTVVTSVRVKSGETAVLAGLISDEEQITIKKVPFLGDIPLLGELFKHRERRPAHREVLIFVTPTIVEN
jgi:type II secretory pathway component GspD/PulD (secretin)